jgi:LysR family glycine cleavage system transcriptional activator
MTRKPTSSDNPATTPARRRADHALSIPRRFLPSLTALSAFEAAARTGSITAAAGELSLTQGAVSRQIGGLEEQLEVRLFYRERRKIRLTPAGHAYVREIREGLKRIGSASMNLRANPSGGTLNVAAPPVFAAKWLIPRLPGFVRAHPAVAVNVLTRETRIHFESEPIDVAIYLGEEDWNDAQAIELWPYEVIPACSPELKRKFAFKSPRDVRRAPLLHLTSWPDAWEQWLTQHRAPAGRVRGILFDQVVTLAAAASAGLGIALLPLALHSAEFSRSELVPALEFSLRSPSSYRLAWPKDRNDYPSLLAFKAWLLAESAA